MSLDILNSILSGGDYCNLALKAHLKDAAMTANQKSLVTELTNGVIRNLLYLDFLIESFCDTHKMKPFIKNLLRLSVYQIVFTDRIPAYAAINESVIICKKRGFGALSGFVNAVLRKINDNYQSVKLPEGAGLLSVKYSVPMWIVEMWTREYGYKAAEQICISAQTRPPVTIRVNTLKTDTKSLSEALTACGVKVTNTNHKNALNISGISDITELDAFKRGLFYVMDTSAMTAVDMLVLPQGVRVLDICAAPGGKSFYMVLRFNVRVTAYDKNTRRLNLMLKTAVRLGLSDSINITDNISGMYPFILLDAPCSGLGVLRKKPDIKFKRTNDDIISLCQIQEELLNKAAGYLIPGGTLLYCTCTLSKRENEQQTAKLAASGAFTLDKEITFMPYDNNADGFYAARMVKRV